MMSMPKKPTPGIESNPWPSIETPPSSVGRVDRLPHAPPNPQAQNRAEGGDDDLADQAIGGDAEQAGEQAADHGADNTDQQIDQQVLLPPHNVRGEHAGDQANHEKNNQAHMVLPVLVRSHALRYGSD